MASAITLNNLYEHRDVTLIVIEASEMQVMATWSTKIPDYDDYEIKQVPSAAYVGAGVHDQTVGKNLSEGLDGEDDEEDILHLFLGTRDLR